MSTPPQPDESSATTHPDPHKNLPEWRLYLAQIPGLWAGRPVPVAAVHTVKATAPSDWKDEDLRLLIDIAQRQQDRLWTQLEQVRGRAQFLFTSIMVAIAFNVTTLKVTFDHVSAAAFALWCVSFPLLLLGLLGSAAVVVNSKDMGSVDAAIATRNKPPLLAKAAYWWADSVQTSHNTVATQITVFRDAALLTILGVVVTCVAWLAAVL